MNVTKLTISQMLIAAGLARNMKPDVLAFHTGVTTTYISKLKKDEEFKRLVIELHGADVDPDNIKFKNIGTLQADIGKYLYNQALKIIHGENDE